MWDTPRRRPSERRKSRHKRPRSCVHNAVRRFAYGQDLCDAGPGSTRAARCRWLTWGYDDPLRIRAPASARSARPSGHSTSRCMVRSPGSGWLWDVPALGSGTAITNRIRQGSCTALGGRPGRPQAHGKHRRQGRRMPTSVRLTTDKAVGGSIRRRGCRSRGPRACDHAGRPRRTDPGRRRRSTSSTSWRRRSPWPRPVNRRPPRHRRPVGSAPSSSPRPRSLPPWARPAGRQGRAVVAVGSTGLGLPGSLAVTRRNSSTAAAAGHHVFAPGRERPCRPCGLGADRRQTRP